MSSPIESEAELNSVQSWLNRGFRKGYGVETTLAWQDTCHRIDGEVMPLGCSPFGCLAGKPSASFGVSA